MYDKFFHNFVPLRQNLNSQLICNLPIKLFTEENGKHSRLKKIKVLLVDDYRMMRECLRKMLDEHDDIVISGEASDGKEAFMMAREICPDIVLMDINMPVMDGIESTRLITQELSQICVIGVSMNNEETIIKEMKSAGASAYLQKSEAFDLLIKTIRSEAPV